VYSESLKQADSVASPSSGGNPSETGGGGILHQEDGSMDLNFLPEVVEQADQDFDTPGVRRRRGRRMRIQATLSIVEDIQLSLPCISEFTGAFRLHPSLWKGPSRV